MEKKKYKTPNPQEMSLLEVMQLRKRKKELDALFRKGKIPVTTPDAKCARCGEFARVVTEKDKEGEVINTYKVGGDRYEVDGHLLCEECFVADWTYIDSDFSPGSGSPVSGIPRSQANYDGGRFNHGEW